MEPGEQTFLRILGHPVLRRRDGSVVEGLRRKDLALLAYLCVEGDRPFSRSHLAALLWGESTEEKARHSLTQALRRAAAGVGRCALAMERDTVRWTGAAVCDAQLLLERDPRLDELLTIYEGPFLEGFEAGFGSEEFSAWADARRAELRRAAVRWLDRAGEQAEREKDWARALTLGERSVQIDREWEGGHRRVMRALLERGERNLALRHFREFARWLTYEIGGHPDPETVALADLIRASAALPFPSHSATPAREPAPAVPFHVAAGEPEAKTSPAAAEAYALLQAAGALPAAASPPDEGAPSVAAVSPGVAAVPAPLRAAALVQKDAGAGIALVVGTVAVLVLLTAGLWAVGARPWDRRDPNLLVERGEVIQAKGNPTAYLVFGHALYGFPDHATLNRCLGSFPRIRQVRLLPPGPKRMLPSVRKNRWLGETDAVVVNDPALLVQYVSVGCVLVRVPDPATFTGIFGHTNWAASARAPDPLLHRLPRVGEAGPFPVRPAATLIQGPGGTIRWVTYHGGALTVPSMDVLATYCRTRGEALRVSPEEFRYYQSYADLPPASVPCAWEHGGRETPIATPSGSRP